MAGDAAVDGVPHEHRTQHRQECIDRHQQQSESEPTPPWTYEAQQAKRFWRFSRRRDHIHARVIGGGWEALDRREEFGGGRKVCAEVAATRRTGGWSRAA